MRQKIRYIPQSEHFVDMVNCVNNANELNEFDGAHLYAILDFWKSAYNESGEVTWTPQRVMFAPTMQQARWLRKNRWNRFIIRKFTVPQKVLDTVANSAK